MPKHSPEPWTWDGERLLDADGHEVVGGWEWYAAPVDMKRAVACVNACKGISTEILNKLSARNRTLADFVEIDVYPGGQIAVSGAGMWKEMLEMEDDHEQ